MPVVLSAGMAGCARPEPARGKALEARLQIAVDDFLSTRSIPGASVAVLRDGRLINIVSGFADVDSERVVTPTTQFRVASVAKMYLSTIALRLVERGELSLNEAVGARIPVLPDHLAFARDLTLRQLLSHTSGLPQTFTRDEDRQSTLDPLDLLDRVPAPVCAPSACWSYADGNFVLAQLLIEAATRRPIVEVFERELGSHVVLHDTLLVDGAALDEPLPPQYALALDASGRPVKPHRLFKQSLPRSTTLITTAADAARFADALFNAKLLRPATLAAMLDTRVMRKLPCPAACPFEYGLGVFRFAVNGTELVGHDGSSGTVVVHDVQTKTTVAILTNGGEHDIGSFLETVLKAVATPLSR